MSEWLKTLNYIKHKFIQGSKLKKKKVSRLAKEKIVAR